MEFRPGPSPPSPRPVIIDRRVSLYGYLFRDSGGGRETEFRLRHPSKSIGKRVDMEKKIYVYVYQIQQNTRKKKRWGPDTIPRRCAPLRLSIRQRR